MKTKDAVTSNLQFKQSATETLEHSSGIDDNKSEAETSEKTPNKQKNLLLER